MSTSFIYIILFIHYLSYLSSFILENSEARESLRPGDIINVRIEALDVRKAKLKLSTKPSISTSGDHWYNDWYSGLIFSINRGGVVVAVVVKNGDYQTGFLPQSQMPSGLNHFELLVGQEVRVRLLSFQAGNITLSMLDESVSSMTSGPSGVSPTVSVFSKVPPTKWILGFVVHSATVGFFVTLQLDGVQVDALLRHVNTVLVSVFWCHRMSQVHTVTLAYSNCLTADLFRLWLCSHVKPTSKVRKPYKTVIINWHCAN